MFQLWLQLFTDGNLSRHAAAVYESKKPFKCIICDYNCSQKGNLATHFALVHEEKKSFKCSTCGYNCSKKAQSTRHIAAAHEKNVAVLFVIRVFQKEEAWQHTFHQFIMATNHSSVPIVIKAVHWSTTCLGNLKQFMKAKTINMFHLWLQDFNKTVFDYTYCIHLWGQETIPVYCLWFQMFSKR